MQVRESSYSRVHFRQHHYNVMPELKREKNGDHMCDGRVSQEVTCMEEWYESSHTDL